MGTDIEVSADQEVIFFDGVCNLCNSSVNFVIDRDIKKRYYFASLQSEFAKNVLSRSGIEPLELESILLKRGKRIFRKSDAVLEVVRHLPAGWPLLYALKIIPLFIRNRIYDFIASHRYKWFGKSDTCRLPTPELKQRFLDSVYVP